MSIWLLHAISEYHPLQLASMSMEASSTPPCGNKLPINFLKDCLVYSILNYVGGRMSETLFPPTV